jgi:predicted metal-binding membrane protein
MWLSVPLEGHWGRVNTPLRRLTRRERNVVFAAVAVTLAAILILVLATAGNSRPAPAPGCIYAIVPGVMGATPVDECGARAKTTCTQHETLRDPGSRSIQTSCRRAGLL